MKINLIIFLLFSPYSFSLLAQKADLQQPFQDCKMKGSITIFDYKAQKWIYSDEKDAKFETVPASTFKILNSLIAIEEGIIKDPHLVVKWDGVQRDISPWNADTDLANAYKNPTLWFYQEIARKLGKEKYKSYLKKCGYGNQNLKSEIDRFWLDGSLKISPKNQVDLLVKLYERKLPFSQKTYDIVKEVMINEKTEDYTLYAKTGWGKVEAKDIGWWVGYFETKDNVYFFATRVWKYIEITNEDFMACRKNITYKVMEGLGFIPSK